MPCKHPASNQREPTLLTDGDSSEWSLPALSYGVTGVSGKVGVVTSAPCKKNHTCT